MGQRLNLEIQNNGEALANSYYHWSGYSTSSLELTLAVISAYKEGDSNVKDALRLLQATGARITKDSWDYGVEKGYFLGDYSDFMDRNSGLIGISPEEIHETRGWAEGTVVIHLDKKTIDFECCHEFPDAYEEGVHPYLVEDIESRKGIPFEKVQYLSNCIEEAENNHHGAFKIGDEVNSSIY